GEFAIEQFILLVELVDLLLKEMNALFESGNLRILGTLTLATRWLSCWCPLSRQFTQTANLLSEIGMSRVIEKGFRDVGCCAHRGEVDPLSLLLEALNEVGLGS